MNSRKQVILFGHIIFITLLLLLGIAIYKSHIESIKQDSFYQCLQELKCSHLTLSLEAQLDIMIGSKHYFYNNDKSNNNIKHITIIKRFDVSFDGSIIIYDYPPSFVTYLNEYFRNITNSNIVFTVAPHVPNSIIQEEIKKEKLKLMLLVSLFGTFGLFAGVFIYRIIVNKRVAIK